MTQERWIDQQRSDRMFRGTGKGNDADRMLEISPTNRILHDRQSKLLIALRLLKMTMQTQALEELCVMVETAQECIDAESRHNFMKVAIEQWQGKLANLKHKTIDILT